MLHFIVDFFHNPRASLARAEKFLKGFLWKIEAGRKILKGYPLFHTRASLARAAFYSGFLL